MNGAETLVRTLLAGNVDVCFANPGTSEMHFVAALDQVPGTRCVLALHETVATGAADGYWRIAGKPAATLLHLGPGLANGLSNLHNAKKAGSGIVNVVGEHGISHLALDAPLTADIQGLAKPMSHWVRTSMSSKDIARDAAEAVTAANTAPGQIATLILPGDTAWNEGTDPLTPEPAPKRAKVDGDNISEAIDALKRGGKTLLLLGNAGVREDALEMAGRIAAKTGCAIMSEWANANMDRGAGRVRAPRVAYVVEQAVKQLEDFDTIVLAGAKPPIAFFAYPDKPGILSAPGTQILKLASVEEDIAGALKSVAEGLGALETESAGVVAASRPDRPAGPLTPENIGQALGAMLPENAIVVDESITTGRNFFPMTEGAPPHTWLNNLGGSIGLGLPMATGAAIAAPDRKVLALIGDGSAMYSQQALWTMARENLDVTVLIFANHTYHILLGELRNVGVQNAGPRAMDMLTMDRPRIDWVELAQSMGVAASRVDEASALCKAMEVALAARGPQLIELAM